MTTILARVPGRVTYGGLCAFTPTIVVDEARDDSGVGLPESFDLALDFDSSTWDAFMSSVVRAKARLKLNGIEIKYARFGDVAYSEDMDTGNQATAQFQTIGELFAIPSLDQTLNPYDPCPTGSTITPTGSSPLASGNKLVEVWVGAASGHDLKEIKLFRGRTFQRSNQKDTGISASFSAVDESLLYSKAPLCYGLDPLAGKRRGEIVRDLAEMVGIDPDTVEVPLGKIVKKPLQISKGSLLPLIKELGRPENWEAWFDEFGILVVQPIELKTVADFTLDASRGDYFYDTLTEQPPTNPPTSYYVTASEVADDGDGEEVTTRQTDIIVEFYAPECVVVRPSGETSYPYADGSYRSIPTQQLMIVSKVITETTKRRGIPIRQHVERWQFYNPKARNPNWDSLPPGSNYDDAYSDKTFHRDEVESLMKVSEEITESKTDEFGTLQRQVLTEKGWLSPRHALNFFYPTVHRDPVSATGVAYMYTGGVMRIDPVEKYITTKKTSRDYIYGSDGVLINTIETAEEWFSAPSRCDILEDASPDTPPIPVPPEPPPRPRPWAPSLSGPIRRVNSNFFFTVDISQCPPLGGGGGGTVVVISGFPAGIVTLSGTGTSGNTGGWTPIATPFFNDATPRQFEVAARLFFTKKPANILYCGFQIFGHVTGGPQAGNYYSAILKFDPWAGLPPGADLSLI